MPPNMSDAPNVYEYMQALKASRQMGHQVAFHQMLAAVKPVFRQPARPWPGAIQELLKDCGILQLYQHQVQAVDYLRQGRHVVVATPTASGKTLIYNLPVLEKILSNPNTRALYIFPLKALAQDQKRVFDDLGQRLSSASVSSAIYDGDTTAWHRKKIRTTPPNVILTNPEMLHLSFLPYHRQWQAFFRDLAFVVVDEVHTYRGVLGSHMAQVFRRLRRICEYYGASPTFVFSSATVANPAELTQALTGLRIHAITRSGAPQGQRHVAFINPIEGPAQAAITLLRAALPRGMRTIVYTQSRKLTELIALWAGSRSGPFANRISAYRAGFLPEERRDIEAKLSNGELLAVISTSALELGIDIGDLELCLLVGYPGTVMATWQRGGRVGRGGQDSALIMIAGEDALDQYFIRNPSQLMRMQPEAAVINPYNPQILSRHLTCAAAELPLRRDEEVINQPEVQKQIARLEASGELLRSAEGETIHARRKSPHRDVGLRQSGSRYTIIDRETGTHKGEIDAFRAFRETHPGAIYLHLGMTYLVEDLDLGNHSVQVSQANVNYYTRVRAHKDTEIMEIFEEKSVWGTRVFRGWLKVTDQVTGYEKWQINTHKRINIISLELPPQRFETEGLWFIVPPRIQQEVESRFLHFMGGIHAIEHAAIGIFPLLVLTDRNDLGGISIPIHPQLGTAAVFIYDAVPGGAGLTRQAFEKASDLLGHTLQVIKSCDCEAGCPACVHSPKCGSGNRPIDKASALFLLERIRALPPNGQIPPSAPPASPETGAKIIPFPTKRRNVSKQPALPSTSIHIAGIAAQTGLPAPDPVRSVNSAGHPPYVVLDIETQLSAQEVGGWHRADLMKVSCAVLYDSQTDTFLEFLEDQVPALIKRLAACELVVGFNIKRFDYRVLSGYSNFDFTRLPTLDILEQIHQRLGFRLSLDHLAQVTLGREKSADGLQALKWWKQGRIREIVEYCREDVNITRQLFLFGMANQYLLFNNKAGQTVRIPVSW